MNSERNIINKLTESKKLDENLNNEKVYHIKCVDDEGTLFKLLEAIERLGKLGHSCQIVVDPGSDGEEKFYYDGDGSDRIKELTKDTEEDV